MVSMWRSKKNGEQQDTPAQGEGASDSQGSTQREPNERTRLLASNPPLREGGYLDPDDPAVSPLNLWSVRVVRFFTVLFAMITFVWWVLLLVSIFATPPGMNTRGSGFTDFSYSCLTLGYLIVSLIFFLAPSGASRISMALVAVLLLVDMIIIVSVPRIRAEEGWVGIVAVVWSMLIAVWCVVIDRTVAWGKREEEERLTGRPESRRTLAQWLGVLATTIFDVIFIIIVILLTCTLILRAIDAGLAFDGERYSVDGDKYKVHMECVGSITKDSKTGKVEPTILLESGEMPSESGVGAWINSAYQNGTISRYCYWDRPGYAWSDDAPSPHSAGMSAQAFSEALALAGEEGPWIAVSAGYGSIVSRIFTSRNLRDVVGIMLIDPLHEDLLHRIGGAGQGFVLWGYGILSPLGIQRIGGAIFNGRTKEDRVFGKSVWQTGKFIKSKLQENLVADSLTKSEVLAARNIMSDQTPLVLVSSGINVRKDKEWEEKQKDLSNLTSSLVSWTIVNKAPHEVWETLEGRTIMEKELGKLVKDAKKRM